jgi:ABC-type lipoprotein release transport system permease subunit
MAELDRSLLVAPIATVRDGFGLADEAHTLALRLRSPDDAEAVAQQLAALVPQGAVVRPWQAVMPELKQAIDVDKIGGQLMYGIIMMLVMFSVVNAFIMTIFERTREFGMMLAIGMRPRTIIGMLQWEALFLWMLGVLIGGGLAVALIFWIADVGIYLGEDMQAYAKQFYMPARLYPGFSSEVLLVAPVVMLLGTQLAALLPGLRIHRIRPVVALRST